MIYSPWFIELALEVLGAMLYFRRSRLLCSLFSFLAASDIILTAGYHLARQTVYWQFYWAQRFGKYFILILLACSICGMFVAEKDRSAKIGSSAIIALGTFGLVTVVFCMAHSLKDSLLAAEIAANVVMAVIIWLAWLGRRSVLSAEQKSITLGFIVLIASDIIFTAFWMNWHGARHFYPLGMITAYLIWVAGPLRKITLPECRADLGKKFGEIQKVQVM